MKIEEFAEIIDQKLIINFVPKRIPNWYCNFERSDIKGNGVLIGSFGNGKTPEDALRDYAKIIAGKTLVLNAGLKEYRKEFNVPEGIK